MPDGSEKTRASAKDTNEARESASDVPFSSKVFAAARDDEPASKKDLEATALSPGSLFHGSYEIVRCIKSGGMGAVYEVLQTTTQRRRALKVMLPSLVTDPEMRARFKLEATVAANIDSEHIVETLDAGVDEATGMPFIVMELLKGEELGRMVRERGRLSKSDVVKLFYQAALALDKTHAAGIVHRDLKPENLFVTRRDDGSLRLKILDFGVAKIVAETTVPANATRSVGSPLYMSPEQIRGDAGITPRADLYSLAHIAYTLLTGRAYWVSERRAMAGLYPFLLRVMEGAQEPPSKRSKSEEFAGLPPAFDAWFAKAAALLPQDRFDKATTMAIALADALGVARPSVVEPEDENKTMSLDLELDVVSSVEEGSGGASKAITKAASSERSLSSQTVPLAQKPPAKRRGFLWLAAGLLAVFAVILVFALSSREPVREGAKEAKASASEPINTAMPSAVVTAAPVPSAAAVAAPPEGNAAEAQPASSAVEAPVPIAVSALPNVEAPAPPPLPQPSLVKTAAPSAKKPEPPKPDPLNEY